MALGAVAASPINSSAQTNYDSVDTYVRTGHKTDIWCAKDCTFPFTDIVAPNYAQAEIFLSSWSLHPVRGGTGELGANISAMKLVVDRVAYNSTTGQFHWKLDAAMTGSNGLGVGVSISYVIVLSNPSAGGAHLTRTTSECNEGDTGITCIGPTTDQLNARPTNTRFLGYAIRGFDVRTASGTLISPWQLTVQVNGVQAGPVSTTIKQTTTCAFIGESSSAGSDGVECEVHAVGVAAPDLSINRKPDSTFTVDWPTTWYFGEDHFAPSGTIDGVLLGQKGFDVYYPKAGNLWLLEAGCDVEYPSSNPNHPNDVSIYRRLLMQNRQMWAWSDFEGTTSCFVGELLQ